MSQLTSILMLKLQRQQLKEQQAREDNARADAATQGAVQQLISGQAQLAQQQLQRDKLALDSAKQRVTTELGRQKQQMEYLKWQADMAKDMSMSKYYEAKALQPHAPPSHTYLNTQQMSQGAKAIQRFKDSLDSREAANNREIAEIRKMTTKGFKGAVIIAGSEYRTEAQAKARLAALMKDNERIRAGKLEMAPLHSPAYSFGDVESGINRIVSQHGFNEPRGAAARQQPRPLKLGPGGYPESAADYHEWTKRRSGGGVMSPGTAQGLDADANAIFDEIGG